jgi:hypothetical protein
MMRNLLAVGFLAALVATYWVNPAAAWIVLGSTATLALARYVRQRDMEAEAALEAAHRDQYE